MIFNLRHSLNKKKEEKKNFEQRRFVSFDGDDLSAIIVRLRVEIDRLELPLGLGLDFLPGRIQND